MAKDVVRLMEYLKLEKTHLVGYSMGAFIAAKVIELQPNRVRSVIFGGQGPILNSRKDKGFSEADALAKAVESGRGLGDYITAIYPEGAKPGPKDAERIAEFMFRGKDAKALAASGQGFGGLEVSEAKLRKYNGPTMFIYGADETAYVKSTVEAGIKIFPKSEVIAIKGANHVTTLMNPLFGQSIVKFLLKH
jgi:pimeloyl-ACP methyl ester carboxylesterase